MLAKDELREDEFKANPFGVRHKDSRFRKYHHLLSHLTVSPFVGDLCIFSYNFELDMLDMLCELIFIRFHKDIDM